MVFRSLNRVRSTSRSSLKRVMLMTTMMKTMTSVMVSINSSIIDKNSTFISLLFEQTLKTTDAQSLKKSRKSHMLVVNAHVRRARRRSSQLRDSLMMLPRKRTKTLMRMSEVAVKRLSIKQMSCSVRIVSWISKQWSRSIKMSKSTKVKLSTSRLNKARSSMEKSSLRVYSHRPKTQNCGKCVLRRTLRRSPAWPC